MARIRTIKPDFWDDLKISKLSRDIRLLYIGMWNFADDLGVIIGDHVWIKSKIFPFDSIQLQQFDKWIEVLVQSGFISLLSHNGERFYYLPNLTRHQVINKPNYEKVNIQKIDLGIIMQSRNNTGIIPEQSRPIEERKGIDNNPPIAPLSGGGGVKKFIKPVISEISEYCLTRKNGINPEEFFDFYESKGWMIGKNKMKDWKAAVRTWERNRNQETESKRYADE